jgi:3-dehydroquinate dehydratase-2
MRRILVLNGPNLSHLGSREPDVYGFVSWDELASGLQAMSSDAVEVVVRQTNSESELIGWIHEAYESGLDVVLNPAAFTHYSYALRDAVAMLTASGRTVIEVHISNPHAREEFRHNSVVAGVVHGVIAGFGIESYRLALHALGVK